MAWTTWFTVFMWFYLRTLRSCWNNWTSQLIRDRADILGLSPYCNWTDYSSILLFHKFDCLLGGLPIFQYWQISWCTFGLANNFTICHISHSETLTSATYRLLRHTTHTLTPIGLKCCTYVQANVLYKIAIGTTNLCRKKNLPFEFCDKHVFANSSYIVHLIRKKNSSYHHYTKLANPYQKLGKILFPSEAINQRTLKGRSSGNQ